MGVLSVLPVILMMAARSSENTDENTLPKVKIGYLRVYKGYLSTQYEKII